MYTKYILTLFILLMYCGIFAQEVEFDLYLLLGQSNMAGRGEVEEQDTIIHNQVFALNKDNIWVPAQDPIHFDKKVAGTGPGRTFGMEMARMKPGTNIGLIPCAVGGSSIEAWKPGGYHDQTKTYPWDDMEKRLMIALKSGKVKGAIWHQGESDSNPERCTSYKKNLEDLIFRIRSVCENENLPFVAGELGRFKLKDNRKKYPAGKPSPGDMVVKATKEIVKNDPHAAFVKSNGLEHKGDGTHFDSKSCRILGKRYARAMKKLHKE